MAIGSGSVASFDHDTGTTGGWSVTAPAGVGSSDVMLAFVDAIGSSVTFTPPSGWTALSGSPETGNANVSANAYWSTGALAGAGPYVWTPSIGAKGSITIKAYTGVDTTTPIDASAHNTNQTNGTTASPAVTPATSGPY